MLLSHADRSRIIDADDRRRVMSTDQINFGTVLIDGFARATWRIRHHAATATLQIGLLDPVSDPNLEDVTREGERLLAFVEPDAQTRELQFFSVLGLGMERPAGVRGPTEDEPDRV